jgi:IS30 family transposase
MHERHQIDQMLIRGWSQAIIAGRLGRSPSTISRELRRNHAPPCKNGLGGMDCYIAGEADRLAHSRQAVANARRAKIDEGPLGHYVREKLACYWSPQQIAQRLLMDHGDDPAMRISHEAIYQWVYQQARDKQPWHRYLRRMHKRRQPRIPLRGKGQVRFAHAKRIDQRPAVVDTRQRLGDWESDTVVGNRRSRAVLVTHVERKSRYVLIRKLPNARAATLNRVSIQAFKPLPPSCRHTMTVDNGSEFARFGGLEKRLGLGVYFAQPYKAWQRGANENANGLIRQFFPKGMDLSKVTAGEVARVQDLLNNRPRKCLNYRTPEEVFRQPPPVALRI